MSKNISSQETKISSASVIQRIKNNIDKPIVLFENRIPFRNFGIVTGILSIGVIYRYRDIISAYPPNAISIMEIMVLFAWLLVSFYYMKKSD